MRYVAILLLFSMSIGAVCTLRAEAAGRGSFALGTPESSSALAFDPFTRAVTRRGSGGVDTSITVPSGMDRNVTWRSRPPIRTPFRPPIRSPFRPPMF